MRRILYIAILLALSALPSERMDIGRLLPVETIQVSGEEGDVRIRTDTGNTGAGKSLEEAYLDLKEHAAGEIFLDTADYLILSGTGDEWIDELNRYLRPGVLACRSEEEIDLEEVSLYLSVHRPGQRLKDIRKGSVMEVLTQTETGFELT